MADDVLKHLKRGIDMLFHITQTHTPDDCPVGSGGSSTLYNPEAEGAVLKAMYGAFSEHVIFYIVEADSFKAVNQFLLPGFKHCTCTVTPVAEEALAK